MTLVSSRCPTPPESPLAPLPSGVSLRDYQRDALNAVEAAEARGVRRQLIVLPTGCGKTIVFAELIRRRRGRALVLVHRDELVRQAVEKLGVVSPDVHVGVVKAERDETHAAVVVASVQTVSREARLTRLGRDFGTVIIDEAHHLPAESYQRVLRFLHAFEPNGPLAVGVTATPERADGEALDGWPIVYCRGLLEMIQRGYLADLRAIRIGLEADFSKLHVRAGDFVDREAEEILLEADAPQHAVAAYLEHAPGRRAVVFTPTVRVAHEMAKAFEAVDVRAAAIDGGTPLEIRRDILARFHRGEISVVANCGVLVEGYDAPTVDCIIVARPTRSRLLYVQMLGRGTRPYPGKDDCFILDLVGATDRHDLMTAATVLGVKREHVLAARGVLAALAEEHEEEAQREHAERLVAHTVDLFRRRPLHWVSAGPGRFTMALGKEGLLVLRQRDGERWDVIHRDRTAERIVSAGLPLDYAQGTAEDLARQMGAAALIDPAAAWRMEPATERQLAALRRCRIHSRPGLTRGEASDLLTATLARARR